MLSQEEMHILFSFTVTYLQAELSKKSLLHPQSQKSQLCSFYSDRTSTDLYAKFLYFLSQVQN